MQRHEEVSETAKQRRDDHEEHHQDAVTRDQNVPKVTVRGTRVSSAGRCEARAFQTHVLNARIHKLHAHVDREGHRDEPGETCGQKIKNSDVFVVCGHEPAGKEPAFVFVSVAMNGCVRHARVS